ncbi:MAG: hypothetical protein ACFFFG_09700 [Candidatus Thorarchaeota archaeon]
MASIIDIVWAYFIYFLPTLVISLLAVMVGIMIYVFGKRKNNKIMDSSFEDIKQSSSAWIDTFILDETSTIGRSYRTEFKQDLAIQNLRLHYTMVPRHLIVSKLGALVRKRKDYVLIEADPRDKIVHRYQLEILARSDEKGIKSLMDMLGRMEVMDFRNKDLDAQFLLRVNDLEFFQALFEGAPNILKIVFSARKHLVRVSLYPLATPSIRVVAKLDEDTKSPLLLRLVLEMTTNLAKLGNKGFYAKQRVGRVVKDPSIKDDGKPRFPGEPRSRNR